MLEHFPVRRARWRCCVDCRDGCWGLTISFGKFRRTAKTEDRFRGLSTALRFGREDGIEGQARGQGPGGAKVGCLRRKSFYGGGSEEEAGDVGHVGYASVLDVGYGAYVDELDDEPEADEEDGGDVGDADEEEEEKDGADAVAGIGDEEGSHDGGDGSAGAEGGDVGAGGGGDLGGHGDEAAEDVEEGEAEGVHGVFHGGSEGPEEDHVAADVDPAAVEEHGGEQGDEAVAGADVGGDGGPLVDEGVAALELEEPDEEVEGDEEDGGVGKVGPAPGYVS